jgi:predicted NUDIX family phosphoesterase
MSEQVLVIPTEVLHKAGTFHGFTPEVDRYLPRLLDPVHFRFLERDRAEGDPSFKQLIPYLVLRHAGTVFHYTRGGGGEARLRARRSVGVGGHIAPEDGGATRDAYRAGLLRELAEEVVLGAPYRERCIGLINDDRTPVGQVHLGIVHVLDLASQEAHCREPALVDEGFAPLEELRRQREAFETWSQFLLDGPWLES